MSPNSQRVNMSDLAPSVQQEVARLAASPEVRSAFNWFRTQEAQLTAWQMEMARIPAPPFGESARGEWLAERFREVGPALCNAERAHRHGVSGEYAAEYSPAGKPHLRAGSV